MKSPGVLKTKCTDDFKTGGMAFMKKKLISLALSLCMLGSMLAGCGNAADSTSSSSSSGSNTQTANAASDGKIKIGKLNSDDESEIAAKYNIMSIPSFLIFKNGEVVDSLTGAMSGDALAKRLDAVL